MPLQFPWQAFIESQRQKNQQQLQMGQQLAQGFGAGLEGLGQGLAKQRQNKLIQDLLQKAGAPQGPPPTAEAGGAMQPTPQGPPQQDMFKTFLPALLQADPKAAISLFSKSMPNPLQQSKIARNYAQAKRYEIGRAHV